MEEMIKNFNQELQARFKSIKEVAERLQLNPVNREEYDRDMFRDNALIEKGDQRSPEEDTEHQELVHKYDHKS